MTLNFWDGGPGSITGRTKRETTENNHRDSNASNGKVENVLVKGHSQGEHRDRLIGHRP